MCKLKPSQSFTRLISTQKQKPHAPLVHMAFLIGVNAGSERFLCPGQITRLQGKRPQEIMAVRLTGNLLQNPFGQFTALPETSMIPKAESIHDLFLDLGGEFLFHETPSLVLEFWGAHYTHIISLLKAGLPSYLGRFIVRPSQRGAPLTALRG
nr:hypothetical protein [Aestuariispira insulae]